jgi:hypothetical protein
MQASPFSYQELNTNNTKTIQNQNYHSNKLCIHTITLYKGGVLIVTNTLLHTKQKETNQETS